MVYVALLRGINVGGKNTVPMQRLRQMFEKLGFKDAKTYINSGNVIFSADKPDALTIEAAFKKEFGFTIPVVLRSSEQISDLLDGLPKTWVNDEHMRCDVMFLWPVVDSPEVVKQFPYKPEIEDVVYLPGAVIWRIDRDNVRRGAIPKIIGTQIYKQLTIRNLTTVRKLYELMKG